jgi:hypothetical protein
MTDNQTTELLCKLLDERGIEWKDGDAAYEIEWSTPDGRHCSAMYWKPTFTVLISGCTPEQAIAATLGSGALTADDVLNAVYKHGARWQAIADELNAELGSGTCENKAKSWGEFECSECEFCADFGSDLHRVRLCPDCGRTVRA